MNDIDRSVESMDFAMRRRFIWEEVTAKQSAINMGIATEKSYENTPMGRLNEVIKGIDGLGEAYQLGGAYFLNKDETLENRWKLRIEPLLREYLRGTRDYKETMKKLYEAYFDTKHNAETNPNQGQPA